MSMLGKYTSVMILMHHYLMNFGLENTFMIKLIRETPKDDIFSRQQWWLAGESYEVLVSYEQPRRYIHSVLS